jgi:hypothetical protein
MGVQVGSTQPLFIFLSAFAYFFVMFFFMTPSFLPVSLRLHDPFFSNVYVNNLSDGSENSPAHIHSLPELMVNNREAINFSQQPLLGIELDFIICLYADNACQSVHCGGSSLCRLWVLLLYGIVRQSPRPDNPPSSEFILRNQMNLP